jgi:Ion channel
MFEGSQRPLLSRRQFAARMLAYAFAAVILDGLGLAAGATGYHYLEGLDWLDATLNAAMIMTGNGPAHLPQTPTGKIFAICNALLGVILFVAVIGMLLTPLFHRMLHAFHIGHRPDNQK